ncbi:MAG: urease accessory protein UreE [Bradyrhizobiaceae bacterium]|nr:urease accessory protein UreE [Bradyrhizobiaceae bacterium]
MIRATNVLLAGTWDRAREIDCIALAHDDRHRRRIAMQGEGGTEFLLDLAEAAHLRDGDGIELESGRVVRVVAASEPVADITGDPHLLSRVAWHIGNRHVPAQILPDRIRIGRDHVLEEMVEKLGAKVSRVSAPFDPEPGAYAGEAAHGHSHGHHNHQDPAHGHRHEH